MAEGAGVYHVPGCHVAGIICNEAAPGRGMCHVGRMAIFTAARKSAFGNIESRVAPRSAGRRVGMAPLAVGQIHLGQWPMERGISERNDVRRSDLTMTECIVKTIGCCAWWDRGI